jgi:hypothetical protein
MDTPPPLPQSVSLSSRWVTWIAASIVLPALPWLMGGKDPSGTIVPVLTVFALMVQLGASIWLAAGMARKRGLSIGAVIGLTIAFMAGSVAIGCAVWFASCLATQTINFK